MSLGFEIMLEIIQETEKINVLKHFTISPTVPTFSITEMETICKMKYRATTVSSDTALFLVLYVVRGFQINKYLTIWFSVYTDLVVKPEEN